MTPSLFRKPISRKLKFALLLLAAQMSIFSWGQDISPEDESVSNQEPLYVSSPFGNETPAFQPELQRTNYLDAGVGVSSRFDDNTLNSASDPKSDVDYSVIPRIALRQSRGRLNWKLHYDGGFTAHQRFTAYNQASHIFGVAGSYKLARHVELAIADDFRMSSGFFDQLNQSAGSSPGNILQQPNQSVITPIAYENRNMSLVQINDQFSRDSAIGGNAAFFFSHYKDVPVGTLLIDTTAQEAEGYYNRRLSPKHSLGLTYRFQRFTFYPISNDTTVHSLLATYALRPQTHMTLIFFGGPQYIGTMAQDLTSSPVNQPSPSTTKQRFLSGASGASFVWNGERTGITLTVRRVTSDGGGLLGAVTLTGGGADFRRQLSRKVTVELMANYGLSDALGLTTLSYSSLKSASGGATISRQLNHWEFALGYARLFQQLNTTGNSLQDINHNRVWSSISYQFSRPLGRN